LRILHTPFAVTTGGREIFIRQLIKHFPDKTTEHRGMTEGDVVASVDHDGIPLHILPKAKTRNRKRAYYSGIYDDVPGFEALLKDFLPDIVHFHDQGTRASLSHLRICKKHNIKTVLTFHSPGQFCLQRSLLFMGRTPCDGIVDYKKCSYCQYRTAGFGEAISNFFSFLAIPFDRNGAIFKRNAVELFYDSRREFFQTVDAIQVHARWAEKMFLSFGIKREKLHFIELGGTPALEKKEWKAMVEKPMRLVYIGRCQEIKGVHLLVDAVKQFPASAPIEVHFFGPYWDSDSYGQSLLKKIDGDRRFCKPRLLPQENVANELKKMDVCVIPSLWPETGPLTVFDAFASGLPVIGTNYAGIAERVSDGENGLLFEWASCQDLYGSIKKLLETPELILELKNNIDMNRTFSDMAVDFQALYEALLLEKSVDRDL